MRITGTLCLPWAFLRVPSFLYSIGTDNFRKSVGEIWKEIHVQTRVFLRGIVSKPSNPFPVQLHSERHITVKQQFKVSFSYFAIIHEFSLAISSFHCPTVVQVHQGLFHLLQKHNGDKLKTFPWKTAYIYHSKYLQGWGNSYLFCVFLEPVLPSLVNFLHIIF